MIVLPEFHQGSPEWGDLTLAPSRYTMRGYGCYSVALCAMLYAYGIKWTPAEFRNRAVEHHGYDINGMLIWNAIRRMTGDRVFWHERVYTTNDPRSGGLEMNALYACAKVTRYLDLGQPVLLAVDAVGNDGLPDHAVAAEGFRFDPDNRDLPIDFKIMDPARGRKYMFSELYGDPRRKLYGYATLIGAAQMWPDDSVFKNEGKAIWKQKCIEKGINVDTYARELVDTMLTPTIEIN